MSLPRRQVVLASALIATLGLCAWVVFFAPPEEGIVEPVRKGTGTVHGAPGATAPTRTAAAVADSPGTPSPGNSNVFAGYSYQPQRAAPVAAIVPAAPAAPPPPFVYTGRLVIDGRTSYLFLEGAAPVRLASGESSGAYRLVDASTGQFTFLHLPTGQEVFLSAPVN